MISLLSLDDFSKRASLNYMADHELNYSSPNILLWIISSAHGLTLPTPAPKWKLYGIPWEIMMALLGSNLPSQLRRRNYKEQSFQLQFLSFICSTTMRKDFSANPDGRHFRTY